MVGKRVSALGSELAYDQICDHSSDAVAAQLRSALGDRSDLILILGASAIVDRRDVIPSAIEKAGGHIDHFGMPVDPGNLLLPWTHRKKPKLSACPAAFDHQS